LAIAADSTAIARRYRANCAWWSSYETYKHRLI